MKYLVVDIETTGSNPRKDKIHGVGFCWGDGSKYIPYDRLHNSPLIKSLADPNVAIIGHNVRFDIKFLIANGIEVTGPIWDTMRMAHKLDENKGMQSLKALAIKYNGDKSLEAKNELDVAIDANGYKHVGYLCEHDLEFGGYYGLIAKYCLEDCENTWKLFWKLGEELKQRNESVKKIFGTQYGPLDYVIRTNRLEMCLADIELRGVTIDVEKAQGIKNAAELKQKEVLYVLDKEYGPLIEKIVEAHPKLFKKDGWNWRSAKQVSLLLYEALNVPEDLRPRTDSGQYSTKEGLLKELKTKLPHLHPAEKFITLYLSFKSHEKEKTTYTGDDEVGFLSRLEDGRVFPTYNTYLVTDRLSCVNPNMQNLPREGLVRSFFVPKDADHFFAYFDYDQIELRIAAHLSKDKNLINTCVMDDPHTETATDILGRPPKNKEERQIGKHANFLFIYNGSEWRFKSQLWDMVSLDLPIEECKRIKDKFFEKYDRLYAYLQEQVRLMCKYHVVVAETGCVRRLPLLKLGEYIDDRRRRFTGPKEVEEEYIERLIAEKARVFKLSGRSPDKWAVSNYDIFKAVKYDFKKAVNMGLNFPGQHMGSIMTKEAMIALHQHNYQIMVQVHDSVILELHKKDVGKMAEIKRIAETAYPLILPTSCEVKPLRSFSETDIMEELCNRS